MCYQQGRCWRGSYFLLSTLSNRTAYAASKGAEFLELRGTRSSATSNSHPNPCTAYGIEQSLLLPFPELSGNTELWGKWAENTCLPAALSVIETCIPWLAGTHSLATSPDMMPVTVTLTF